MSKPFTLIQPTIIETQLTGFLAAAERTYRGTVWRASYHAGQAPVLIKGGEHGQRMTFADAPKHARHLAIDLHAFLLAASKMNKGN
jgi:hypothetical protein